MIIDLEGSVPDLRVGFMSVLIGVVECRQDLIMAYLQVNYGILGLYTTR